MFGPKNAEEAKIYAIEEFVAETQYCIQCVMSRKGVTRSELAKRLGCTPANVTQMLSEDHNLTLESVAKVFHALEDKFVVSSTFLQKQRFLENRRDWFNAIEDYSDLEVTVESDEPVYSEYRNLVANALAAVTGHSRKIETQRLIYRHESMATEAANDENYAQAA